MSLISDGLPAEFHRIRLYVTTPYAVHIHPYTTADLAGRVAQNDDGSFTIHLSQPSDDLRHIALGKFMDNWSKLELALTSMIAFVFRINPAAAQGIAQNLGMRGIINAMPSVATLLLEKSDQDQIVSILGRAKELNTKRNRIAHGLWVLEAVVSDANGTPIVNQNQVREYLTSDPRHSKKAEDRSNKAFRRANIFSTRRIHAISREVDKLTIEISDFNRSLLEKIAKVDLAKDQFPSP